MGWDVGSVYRVSEWSLGTTMGDRCSNREVGGFMS